MTAPTTFTRTRASLDTRLLPRVATDPDAQRRRVRAIAIAALRRRDTFLLGVAFLLGARAIERRFVDAVVRHEASADVSAFMYTMY